MHPSEVLLTELYSRFAKGDMPGVLEMCHDDIVFEVPGATTFSGTHTKATFPAWIGNVMEICGGKFQETVVRIVANDEHGVAVLDHWLERDGKPIEYRVDHIWELRDGKFTRFIERPGNEEEFNRAWT